MDSQGIARRKDTQVSEIDCAGRVIFTADAYARDGRRFIVLADKRLSAFLELERATGVDSQRVLF
jgi:hypothetical protein